MFPPPGGHPVNGRMMMVPMSPMGLAPIDDDDDDDGDDVGQRNHHPPLGGGGPQLYQQPPTNYVVGPPVPRTWPSPGWQPNLYGPSNQSNHKRKDMDDDPYFVDPRPPPPLTAVSSPALPPVPQLSAPPSSKSKSKSESADTIVSALSAVDVTTMSEADAKRLLGHLQNRASAVVAASTLVGVTKKKSGESSSKKPKKDNGGSKTTPAGRKTNNDWRCDWCKCSPDDTNGKNPGPKGPATLCGACGARYRAGHRGPLVANEHGKYVCEHCGKELDSIAALGGHRRFCDGGQWRCGWCKCKAGECSGKNPGPDGPATLCGACGSRYRAGHKGPLVANANGKYPCDNCGKELDSIAALGGHRRFCDGGAWRCKWCKCTAQQCSGKNPGPDGPATLCGACGSRYRAGHKGPLVANEKGKYACEHCGKELDSIAALGGHRRFCDGGAWRCDWCKCTATECSGKNPGPRGPATLCGACGGRYRAGHSGPPQRSDDGKFHCDTCEKLLDSIVALGVHKRFCDGGKWRCKWCQCKADECSGKNPGPDGPATLCGACGSRYRAGHAGPPQRTEDGKFICDDCGKVLDSMIALGGHRRFCEKGARWQCEWCSHGCDMVERMTGPNGAKTLCNDCGLWYEKGFEGLARKARGRFVCDRCGDRLLGTAAFLNHRDHLCDGSLVDRTYDTGADFVGPTSIALMIKPDDETPKMTKLTFPSKLRILLNGTACDRAVEAWDLARHMARRSSGKVGYTDVAMLLNQRGTWWDALKPGNVAPDDGWTWDIYEAALLGKDSPGFHSLYTAVTKAVIRHDGKKKSSSRKKRPALSPNNWITELAHAFPTDPLTDYLRQFIELKISSKSSKKPTPRKSASKKTDDDDDLDMAADGENGVVPTTNNGHVLSNGHNDDSVPSRSPTPLVDDMMDVDGPLNPAPPSSSSPEMMMMMNNGSDPPVPPQPVLKTEKSISTNLTSKELLRQMQPAERMELVGKVTELVLSSELMLQHIDGALLQLSELIKTKQNAWHRRKLLAREASIAMHQPAAMGRRRLQIRLLQNAELTERHLCELDQQFASLRAVVPSYRRLPLGTDRDGRLYYALGDVWEDLFVRNADGSWFTMSPDQVSALVGSLSTMETHLAETLTQLLPCLEADPRRCVADPQTLLLSTEPGWTTTCTTFCAVCGETTQNPDGTAQPDVLLCDACDADVHFKCSNIAKGNGDEPFTCPVCGTQKNIVKIDDFPPS